MRMKMTGNCKSPTDEDGFCVDARSMKTRVERHGYGESRDLEFGSHQI